MPVARSPKRPTELVARIKALLRRPGGVLGMTLEAGNVRLDTIGRELTIGGIPTRGWAMMRCTARKVLRTAEQEPILPPSAKRAA